MNRFGLKDLILLALVLAVGAMLALDLVQRDRAWGQTRRLEARIAGFERDLEEVRGGGGAKAAADARPGVFIQRQRPWGFVSDPRAMPGYRTGGEVCELLEEPPTTIVPYLHQNLASGRVVDQVVQTLAVFDAETLRLRGVLAEAWQYDPAGLWLRVRLRPEACFSDGKPVTAEDVRWTLHEYVKRPDIGGAASLDAVQRVEVISPAIVEFVFAKPFYSNLAQALTMYVLPAQAPLPCRHESDGAAHRVHERRGPGLPAHARPVPRGRPGP
jgi:ABC-type transport system substrate-binding protein